MKPRSRRARPRTLIYKVIELATVDERGLEAALNAATREGFRLDSTHFAMRESSRRPAMAFLYFVREAEDEEGSEEGVDVARPRGAAEARARLHALARGEALGRKNERGGVR